MSGFIRFIKKQHFWLIVPVLLIVMIATWFMAAGDQIQQFEDGEKQIEGHFSSMRNVQSINPHPNKEFHDGMDALIAARAKDVDEAWALSYDKQRETMKWSSEMKPAFVALVNKMRPIESITEESPILNQVDPWMLQSYRDFIIETELARLAEIIGSRWDSAEMANAGAGGAYGGGGGGGGEGYGGYGGEGGGGGGYGGYGGGGGGGYGGGGGGYGGGEDYLDDEDFNPIVVKWSSDSQSKIFATSFGWINRTEKGEPTVREMLYSQEDLWVLDSMMQVIKATNGDARHRSQAAIKEILALDMGITAKTLQGEISAVQSADAEEEDGMYTAGGGGDGYGDGYGDMAMLDEYDDEEGGGYDFDPLEERYLGENYAPLAASDVRESSEVQVTKRMPVRIRVKMDSRKLAKFLAACANAPLTYEVHQIRINPDASGGDALGALAGAAGGGYGGYGGGGGAGGGYGGYGGEGGGAGGGYGGYGGGGGGAGGGYGGYGGGGGGGGYGGGAEDDMEGSAIETYDKTIEFFGLINIYNPVDKEKLGTATTTEDGDTEEEADGVADDTEGDVALLEANRR